jgi:hypothetical protein
MVYFETILFCYNAKLNAVQLKNIFQQILTYKIDTREAIFPRGKKGEWKVAL